MLTVFEGNTVKLLEGFSDIFVSLQKSLEIFGGLGKSFEIIGSCRIIPKTL